MLRQILIGNDVERLQHSQDFSETVSAPGGQAVTETSKDQVEGTVTNVHVRLEKLWEYGAIYKLHQKTRVSFCLGEFEELVILFYYK